VRDLARFERERFDLLVVGGGAMGAGAARDAALRGMRVALVEQHDFAEGTTSRSTRLIHGGLRYLAQRDFGLVRENLREREILLRTAGHLVRPLPVYVPLYRPTVRQRARLRAGMLLYDLLSRRKSLPRRKWISSDRLLALEPALLHEGLRGAWRFYDAQCALVERLVIENVTDAKRAGALVLNHAKAVRWLRDGAGVIGARVRDGRSDTEIDVHARATLNATGAWLDLTSVELRRGARPLLRLTKGVHLVTPPLTRQALLHFHSDGRPIFILPWLESSLIGTTDTDLDGDPDDVRATDGDVRYLVDAASRLLPATPVADVSYAYAGVRALVNVRGVKAGAVPREHEILDHASDGAPGLVSILGGKLTAYRGIAQEAIDAVAVRVRNRARCATRTRPLPGAGSVDELADRARQAELDDAQIARLLAVYGAIAREIVARIEREPSLRASIAPGTAATRAEVVHAVEAEDAVTLADVLLRRTCLGLARDRALSLVEPVAAICGFSAADIDEYRETVRSEQVEPVTALA
jgi:glycerol-3-phosphate dehydrogenase